MSWNYVRLGDVCSKIGSGATPKGGATVYIDSGISLIRSQNVYNLEFSYDGLAHITEDAAEKLNGVTVLKNDILLNITGDSVARTCIVPDSVLPARVNQHVAIVRPNQKEVNPLFLNYYLASPYMQSFMLGLAVGKGASRNAMTKDMIANFEVPCPPIDIQESIVSILSAYDNLIENNQKQIKLLEEAARRLYKEWFVDLRFPGYEDTPIVDGVPEGWSLRPISDFGEVVTGKTPSTEKKEYYGGNIPFVKIPDMHECVYPVITESSLTEAGAKTQINKFIPRNGIMVSCIATVGLVNIAVERCQTNQQINSIILSDERDLYYVFSAMKRLKELLEGVGSNGATMTNVNKTKFASLPVLYPSQELRDSYYSFCKPIFEKIYNLSLSVVGLKKARDRLLPKLMSGEIEV